MGDDDPISIETWERVARRWGLTPAQLPQAVRYLHAVLCAAEGKLESVEIQVRPEGERYVYRYADPKLAGDFHIVDRPQGWDAEHELCAIEDLIAALAQELDDDEDQQAA